MPAPAYIAPRTPTLYAEVLITASHYQQASPEDRGGHHLQLPHRGLQVRPKQRLQEGNGAETPPLPCPMNWTKGFPRCSRRGSVRAMTAPSWRLRHPQVSPLSAQAIAAQGFRPAQDQNPKTAEAEQTGDGEADRQRGPPAPRGKPRIVTVDVGKHRPAQCSSCWMAARQGQPSHGTRRAGLVAPSRGPATCTFAAAAPARSLRHTDLPGHSQAAAAAPPKGRAAPAACSPRQVQRPDPLDLGPPL